MKWMGVQKGMNFLHGDIGAEQLQQLLRTQFGHPDFRGEQLPIIQHILSGGSGLALMATGTGKSLCYQFPAALKSDLVLVISPLIALMQDQVDKAKAVGIDATFINSSLDKKEREHRYQKISQGRYHLLFVTPERFRKSEFVELIGKRKISLLAVDEAHCISQWGHDFRPDYSRVGEFRKWLNSPPTLALTATATPEVQKDILQQLDLNDAKIFKSGIERPNLSIHVHSVYGLDEKIRNFVGLRFQNPGPAIFYFSLIQSLYKAADELTKLNIPYLLYHGQLASEHRKQQQNRFLQSNDALILATPAFGLGIDKSNIRLIVHAEIPSSVEAYYQEVGRAGRDGLKSDCHLFYDPDDVSIQMEFLKWANPDSSFVRQVYRLLEVGGPGLSQEGVDYLRAQLNFYNKRDFRVETALNLLERWGSIEEDRTQRVGYKISASLEDQDLKTLEDKKRIQNQNQKLLNMVQFADLTKGCRLATIYQYFGDSKAPDFRCEICDLCQKKH
jgi:ATP-dependent DNA helicase RecQ